MLLLDDFDFVTFFDFFCLRSDMLPACTPRRNPDGGFWHAASSRKLSEREFVKLSPKQKQPAPTMQSGDETS